MTEVESTVRKFSKEGKKVKNQGYVLETQDSLNFVTAFNSTLSNFGLDSPTKNSDTEDGFELQDYNGAKKKSLKSSSPVMDQMQPRDELLHHKVIMIGQAGIGKSSLCKQFLTSEHYDVYQSELKYEDDSLVSSEVLLELNGSMFKLTFIMMPGMSWLGLVHGDENVQKQVNSYEPSAFMVVYAVDDKPSLNKASQVLTHLQVTGDIQDKVVVLVATKSDLARARVVSTNTGKALAATFGVKFIETSSGVGHNVDELLVGIVTQLQMKKERLAMGNKYAFKNRIKVVMAKMKPTSQSKESTDIMK